MIANRKDSSFLKEIECLLNLLMGYPAGTEALKSICERHAGTTVYIPLAPEGYIRYRNASIRSEFRGDNYRELALKWGLDERHVRRIVHGDVDN